MILRTLVLAGGLAGSAALSQFPEFGAQYVQRLGGAVDALSEVAADFDASAAAEGLTRDEALSQMSGAPFVERRRADMETTFGRLDQLSADLRALEGAGPFERLAMIPRMTDPEISAAAMQTFEPAVPLSPAGLILAGLGFVLGGGLVSSLMALSRALFARARRPA